MLTLEKVIEKYRDDLPNLWDYLDLRGYFYEAADNRDFDTAIDIAVSLYSAAPYYKYDFDITPIWGVSDFLDAFCDDIDPDERKHFEIDNFLMED